MENRGKRESKIGIDVSFSDIVVLLILIVTLGIFMFVLGRYSAVDSLSKPYKLAEEFNKIALKKFKLGLVSSNKDLFNAANALKRKLMVDKDYPLQFLLEGFQNFLIETYRPQSSENKNRANNSNAKDTNDDFLNKVELDAIYQSIQKMIKKEQEDAPFSTVPKEERRILTALKSSIEENQLENIKFYLSELSSVITTRYNATLSLEATNQWSVPLAIVGILATIILGVLGIFASRRRKPIKMLKTESD